MNIISRVNAVGINPTTWPLAQNDELRSLGGLVSYLLPKALLIGAIIAFVMVVFAGVGVIAGAGSDDPHAKEQSKAFLTYAVIGLIIMFSAFWILQIINYLTGNTLGGIF